METIATVPQRKKNRPRSHRASTPCPCVPVGPGQRVVYGLKAKASRDSGFYYGSLLTTGVTVRGHMDTFVYVMAGQPGREYLLVYGWGRGGVYDREIEPDGYLVVDLIAAADRPLIREHLQGKGMPIFFW